MTAASVIEQRSQGDVALLPVALLIASLFVHWAFWDLPSPDVTQFLTHWYRHLADRGLVEGFSEPFGNYSPPYLYLLGLLTLTEPWLPLHDGIRLLSVLGSLMLGLAVNRLLLLTGARHPTLGGLWTPILPTVFANAGMLSQCDALWVAPSLMAVAASIQRRHATMLAWAGLGFAFKAQAAFLAPFLLAVVLQRRVPLHLWLIPPAVVVGTFVPAWLAGWPAGDLLFTYVHQGGQLPTFVSNAPNPWALLAVLSPEIGRVLVPWGFGLAIASSLWLVWWLKARLADRDTLLHAALLSSLVVPTVLPKMHERYFLLADMLAFVIAFSRPDRRSIVVAGLVALGSSLAIVAYVAQAPLLSLASALPTGIALLLVGRSMMEAGRQTAGA